SVGIKDVILPGEMKEILNRVVEAEKVAQANLIKRRAETAATRSLLNTARLMDENPTLLRLKELETLEKVTEKVDKLTVFGGLDGVLKDVVRIQVPVSGRESGRKAGLFFLHALRRRRLEADTRGLPVRRTSRCLQPTALPTARKQASTSWLYGSTSKRMDSSIANGAARSARRPATGSSTTLATSTPWMPRSSLEPMSECSPACTSRSHPCGPKLRRTPAA